MSSKFNLQWKMMKLENVFSSQAMLIDLQSQF